MNSSRFNAKKGDMFVGEIQDIVNYDSKEWRRRDICFFKATTNNGQKFNYPSMGDVITLIDTSDNRYILNFSKPEDNDKICLGTPKKLKPWYQKKRFSDNDVKTIRKDGCRDKIYFEYSGHDFEFFIFTEDEYRAKKKLESHD